MSKSYQMADLMVGVFFVEPLYFSSVLDYLKRKKTDQFYRMYHDIISQLIGLTNCNKLVNLVAILSTCVMFHQLCSQFGSSCDNTTIQKPLEKHFQEISPKSKLKHRICCYKGRLHSTISIKSP